MLIISILLNFLFCLAFSNYAKSEPHHHQVRKGFVGSYDVWMRMLPSKKRGKELSVVKDVGNLEFFTLTNPLKTIANLPKDHPIKKSLKACQKSRRCMRLISSNLRNKRFKDGRWHLVMARKKGEKGFELDRNGSPLLGFMQLDLQKPIVGKLTAKTTDVDVLCKVDENNSVRLQMRKKPNLKQGLSSVQLSVLKSKSPMVVLGGKPYGIKYDSCQASMDDYSLDQRKSNYKTIVASCKLTQNKGHVVVNFHAKKGENGQYNQILSHHVVLNKKFSTKRKCGKGSIVSFDSQTLDAAEPGPPLPQQARHPGLR